MSEDGEVHRFFGPCLTTEFGHILLAHLAPLSKLTDLLVPQFWTLQENFQTNAKILFVHLLHQEIRALRQRTCSNDEAFAKIILDVLALPAPAYWQTFTPGTRACRLADRQTFTVEMASELVFDHFPTLLDVFKALQPLSTITVEELNKALERDATVAANATILNNTSVQCYVNEQTRMTALKCLLNTLGTSPSRRMNCMTLKVVLCFVLACMKKRPSDTFIRKVTEEIQNSLGYTCDNQLREINAMIRREGVCPQEQFSEFFDKLKADFPELLRTLEVCIDKVGGAQIKTLQWIKLAFAKHPHFNWSLIEKNCEFEAKSLLAFNQYYRNHPYMGFEINEEHKASNFKSFAYIAQKLLKDVNGIDSGYWLRPARKDFLDILIRKYIAALQEPNEANRGTMYVQQARQGMQPFYDALE